jgi:hypothetical protein
MKQYEVFIFEPGVKDRIVRYRKMWQVALFVLFLKFFLIGKKEWILKIRVKAKML